jgi:NAD(P)H-dependent FMN reductase
MKALIIAGSPREGSYSKILADIAYDYAKSNHKEVGFDFLDLAKTQIDSFKGPSAEYGEETRKIISSLKDYDLFIISTPVYNSVFSSAVKNLFEHAHYKEIRGKVAGFIIMSSGKKSHLIVQSQLAAMMTYFEILSNPKAVFAIDEDFADMKLNNEDIEERIKSLIDSSVRIAEKLSG